MRRLRPWLVVAALFGLVALALFWPRPTKVVVVSPVSKPLTEVIALSGRVHGVEESRLAPEISGTIRTLVVDEGAAVKRGQKLAELDTARLETELARAVSGVKVAEAQLAIARRGPLPSEIEEVRSQVRSEQRAAAANLEAAKQRLLEGEQGPRVEEIRQARAELQQAQAQAEQTERESQRQARLLQDGAVSLQSAEQAATSARQAEESRQAARARLALLQNGTRPEQLEQARQAVFVAEAELSAANNSGQARLQVLLDQPRNEDIQLAETQLAQAQTAVESAKKNLEQATILAPYDGVVGRRLLRVGDQAGPTQAIFTFSSNPAFEVRVDVDESDRARLKTELQAEVRANGYKETFLAVVRELAPEVDAIRGTLEARLSPVSAPAWLVPGQTVDVNLLLGPQQERLVVPLTSVILRGDSAQVAVVKDDKVELRTVEVSTPTINGYLVKGGLSLDDKVAVEPQGLTEGQSVRPQEKP